MEKSQWDLDIYLDNLRRGGIKSSDPCGWFGVNRSSANVNNHVIPVWFGIGMGKLSHVSQEDSHMVVGYKYLFLEQTSSFSLLFFFKYWIRHILKRRHIVWDGVICTAEVRTLESDGRLGQSGGAEMINKSTNQVRSWSVCRTPARCTSKKKKKTFNSWWL